MEIVYVYPATNIPVGGVRVAYKHSQALENLGFNSSIFHPRDPTFACSWFQHNAKIKKHKKTFRIFDRKHSNIAQEFDPQKHFLVIPEIWATRYADNLIEYGIKYAIFIQGGYLINTGGGSKGLDSVKRAYMHAQALLVISEDTFRFTQYFFPEINNKKIFKVIPSIDDYSYNTEKENLISFIAKKNPHHARLTEAILRKRLPSNWSTLEIDNVNQEEMRRILGRSRIFLSFAELEGLSLPPLEAAMSGALVIGYTGQGGKEYFKKPLFHEVEFGNIRDFAQVILRITNEFVTGQHTCHAIPKEIACLRRIYSKENESRLLLNFATQALKLLPDRISE